MARTDDHRVRVSVIVPVFEPKQSFDDLIRSLDDQTMDAAEYEVLLCDDGSGEDTRARLADVARTREHVRVLTLEHSGWPGTPRNHGIDAARGRYVFFADQDDRLFDDALRRMCDEADERASDVLVGRVVGVGRRIPEAIFRRDIPRAELGRDPLLQLLTPHKLFRTSFLRDNGIRFPDGRVRLEDHLFVMRAYFAASTISILASESCYAWRKNEGSASSSRIDPETYFPSLAAVLDVVEANTAPGELRDDLLRHWFRGKILKRIEGGRMLRYPDEYRDRFLDVVIPLVRERFGVGVAAGLSFPHRVRSELLRAGRRDDLMALARFESDLECRAELVSVRSRLGLLTLGVHVRVRSDGTDALVFDSEGVWRAPDALGALTREVRTARRDLNASRVELVLTEDGGVRVIGRSRLRAGEAHIALDPAIAFDRVRDGTLRAHVRCAGWTFDVLLRGSPALREEHSPTGITCRIEVGDDGAVRVRPARVDTRWGVLTARGLRGVRRFAGRVLPPGIKRRLTDKLLR
ncbi:glycosyltransferase family 2 protein [Microbacterium sp. NPDC055357]